MADEMMWLRQPLAMIDEMARGEEQIDVVAWFSERIEANFHVVRLPQSLPPSFLP